MDKDTNTNETSSTYSTIQPKAQVFVWSAAFMVVGFFIFILNSTTVTAFIINRHLRRRSVYCLINLAVADMLYGIFRVIQQSLSIGGLLGQTYNVKAWTGINLFGQLVFLSSLFCLVLVSLERVYATFFPFRHRITRLRVYIWMILITWFLPILLTFTSYLLPLDRNYYLIISVSFLVCLIIICTSYTAIFIKVKIRPKQLQMNEQRTAQRREQHLAMTLFIVTVLSLLTWLPLIIFLALRMWYTSLSSSLYSLNVSRPVWLIQITNSLINPIIYVFRMRDFRKALIQLVVRCSRNRNRVYPFLAHFSDHTTADQQNVLKVQHFKKTTFSHAT